VQAACADASLACAEKALSQGRKAEAKSAYQRLLGGKPTKPVAEAATRGMQACDAK
jgi:hypothetical protein